MKEHTNELISVLEIMNTIGIAGNENIRRYGLCTAKLERVVYELKKAEEKCKEEENIKTDKE